MGKCLNSIIHIYLSLNNIKEQRAIRAEQLYINIHNSYRKEEAEREQLPPGTRLLSEEERLETLKNLKESKADIEKMIGKMPISMRTLALQQRKADLEKKVEELDRAIATFSRPKVYIAIE